MIEKTTDIISLTDAAANQVKALVKNSDEPVLGLRVAVSTKGCSGLSYVFEYAKEKNPFEEEINTKGAKIFIDPMATMYLVGAEMDYVDEKMKSGFVFTNPNEKSRCGCGESFNV
ncbi:MAG: iron-sulfur cluster assembly accessory protein [Pseudomonadota bacterium]|nr:iron-sulfur cluster assembly accessory protein [Pseudomonadota bacterium]